MADFSGDKKIRQAIFVLATTLTVFSVFAFCFDFWWFLSTIVIIIVNAYLLLILVAIADISDGGETFLNLKGIIPLRKGGIALFIMFLISIVMSFARIYYSWPGEFKPNAHSHFNAFYASFEIITTVSMGDYDPQQWQGKLNTICEGLSTITLILSAYPLLLSSLNSFSEEKKFKPQHGCSAPVVPAKMPGGGTPPSVKKTDGEVLKIPAQPQQESMNQNSEETAGNSASNAPDNKS